MPLTLECNSTTTTLTQCGIRYCIVQFRVLYFISRDLIIQQKQETTLKSDNDETPPTTNGTETHILHLQNSLN